MDSEFSAPRLSMDSNRGPDDDSNDPIFATDDFRIWCMKVIPCSKRFVHDWTICPFAHAGEKAVRRDPRTHEYTGIACPDMKKGGLCIRGERCPYAHNVFEYWLHPTRYRTQLCNDGPGCRRSICFFAHSLDELRVPACKPYVSPETLARASLAAIQNNPHPLSAQINDNANVGGASSSSSPQNHHQQQQHQPYHHPHYHQSHKIDDATARQEAVLAALNAPSRVFNPNGDGGGPSSAAPHQDVYNSNSTNPGAMAHQVPYNHIDPNPPRLSTDYGSLPRWSNNATVMGGHGHPVVSSIRRSHDFVGPSSLPNTTTNGGAGNGGRFSYDAYRTSLAGSSPVRSSAPPAQSLTASLSSSSSEGSAAAAVAAVDAAKAAAAAAGSSGAGAHRVSSVESFTSTGSGAAAGGGAGGANNSTAGGDTDALLAQSLATLKIALTQQKAAASKNSNTSNHEVVISTLHQLLRDAVATQQQSSGGGGGKQMTESASLSILNGAIHDLASASDTPARMSLETNATTTPPRSPVADTGAGIAQFANKASGAGGGADGYREEDHQGDGDNAKASTYRLNQDLVDAISE